MAIATAAVSGEPRLISPVLLQYSSEVSCGFTVRLSPILKIAKLPARSPNLNAHAERFVRTIKTECTDRLIFFGDRSLYRSVVHYIEFYNRERFHQGMDNELLTPAACAGSTDGQLICRERLGGMLKYYSRRAA